MISKTAKLNKPTMKETIKINLNQRLFDLDADAYQKLKYYLDSLKAYFDKRPGEAEEILQDIEQRIAEIIEEKLKGIKQVVTLADVEDIIQMMGTVDDFVEETENRRDDNEQAQVDDKNNLSEEYSRDHRRLYRDLENNFLGGVCSGIASYFNIDPVWVRLAFVIFLFINGIGLLIYLILWAVVPAARTTAQRLQMRGRPVTVENIQESVKSEYERVKDNINKYSHSESFKRTRDTAYDILTQLGHIVVVLLKVVLILIGIGLAFVLFAFLLGYFGIISTGWNFYSGHFPATQFRQPIDSMFNGVNFFSLALILVIIIPVIAIITGIIKAVFDIRSRSGILSAFAWTIWSLALVYVIISLITGRNLISKTYVEKDQVILDINNSKPLYIRLENDYINGRSMGYYNFLGRDIIRNKTKEECYLIPHFSVKKSDDSLTHLTIERTAIIPPLDKEYRNYQYDWYQSDTILILDKYFSIYEHDIWQLPGMDICLLIPEGQKIEFHENMKPLFQNSDEENYMIPEYDRLLRMKDNKLSRLKP
jgi:phage shock protein PspC (stress-responsive transcriptional regulator)